jgi:coenzyme F420-0:L-glutamate ligase / coenzyme F420-1:gamma-L-glutamate ligase
VAATISITALEGIGDIQPGTDLAGALATAVAPLSPSDGDIVVVAHKVVSKAEDRLVMLSGVTAGPEAERIATATDKDPRLVQVILDESVAVVRAAPGVLITRTAHGFVSANAGVDASNVTGEDTLVLLPVDPDASARTLRAGLRERLGTAPAVCITDSFGRAWRHGQADVAIGLAGLTALQDWRGRPDTQGRTMQATWIAVADQVASAADLVRTKDGSTPVALLRGLDRYVTVDDGPGAGALLRPSAEDLFT